MLHVSQMYNAPTKKTPKVQQDKGTKIAGLLKQISLKDSKPKQAPTHAST